MFGVGSGTPDGLHICGANHNFSHIPDDLKADFTMNGEIVTSSALLDWDGSLDGGGNVMDASHVDGSQFTPDLNPRPVVKSDANEVAIVLLDCDSSLTVFPDSPVSFVGYGPTAHDLLNYLKPIAKSLSDCRTTADLNDDQFDVRFNIFSPKFWMNLITYRVNPFNQGEPFPAGPGFVGDPRRELHDNAFKINDATFEFLSLPSTCTFDYWLANKNCSVEYDGFQSLFGNDIAIRAIVQQCPSGSGAPPRIQLTCEGTACHDFLEPYRFDYCRSDSDCATGSKCINVVDGMFPLVGKLLWDAPSEWQNSMLMNFNFITSGLPPFPDTNWDTVTFETRFLDDVEQFLGFDYVSPRPPRPVIRVPNPATWVFDSARSWMSNVQVEVFGTRHWRPQMFASSSNWNTNTNYYGGGSNLHTAPQLNYVYGSGGPRYFECQDHTFVPGCAADTCDNPAITTRDVINFVRQITGQSAVSPDTSQFQGLCDTNLIRTLGNDAKTKAWRDGAVQHLTSPNRIVITGLNAYGVEPISSSTGINGVQATAALSMAVLALCFLLALVFQN